MSAGVKPRGRGRLSSFDLLPREADDIVDWAKMELSKRERTQVDIYAEFVDRCQARMREHRGEINFVIPAFSSFNRYSLFQAQLTRRLATTNQIASALAANYDAKASDDITVLTGELIKGIVFHMAGEGDLDILPKDLLHIATALKVVQQAQNLSSDRRTKEDAKLAARVDEAVDTVAKARGLTAETAEAIKSQILGVTA